MATINSPNMSLPVPIVGVEVGPAWASDLNVCLSTLDAHNHAPGSGVQINPAGLNINADLAFNSNNAISMRSARFSSQGAAFSLASDRSCLYVVGNELYYSDGAGTQVPITASGSVNAGAGSITGLPSGTASVVYASSTFTFNSATNTRAIIDAGSLVIRNLTASSFGVTIQAPTLSSNYTLVLPALPVGPGYFLQLDNSGNITAASAVDNITLQNTGGSVSVKAGGINTAQMAAGAITTTQINAAAGIVGTQLAAGANIVGTQLTANTLTQTQVNTTFINSGYFTPTSTSHFGCTLVAFSTSSFSRVAQLCTVFGTITVSFAGAGYGIALTIPVAGGVTFASKSQLVGISLSDISASTGTISASVGLNNTLIITGNGTASGNEILGYSYSYQIL